MQSTDVAKELRELADLVETGGRQVDTWALTNFVVNGRPQDGANMHHLTGVQRMEIVYHDPNKYFEPIEVE